ncbi:MAG: hypothetical protein Kapaf2KO_07350 [Candidatus Kapaibacteriales bacterium]
MFNPSSFLTLSKNMQTTFPEEACFRTICINCYYSILITIRDNERQKNPNSFQVKQSLHKDISNFVKRNYPNDFKNKYNRLLRRRRDSSYNTSKSIQLNAAQSSILIAEEILDRL